VAGAQAHCDLHARTRLGAQHGKLVAIGAVAALALTVAVYPMIGKIFMRRWMRATSSSA